MPLPSRLVTDCFQPLSHFSAALLLNESTHTQRSITKAYREGDWASFVTLAVLQDEQAWTKDTSRIKYVLSTMGVSKESISKVLIGNRFHVKSRIFSPENCKQSLQVKSWKADVTAEEKQSQDYNQNFVIQAHKS